MPKNTQATKNKENINAVSKPVKDQLAIDKETLAMIDQLFDENINLMKHLKDK